MTYDNCLYGCRTGGQIDLFISLSLSHMLAFLSKFSLALRSNSFDIKGFLLLLHCCRDAFHRIQNEFPSHSDHNFYHHIQQQLPTTPPHIHDKMKWKWQEKNFSIIRKKGRRKNVSKMKKKEEKFFIFNVVVEWCRWYVIWEEKCRWQKMKSRKNRWKMKKK